MSDVISRFYQSLLPEAVLNKTAMQSPCPFCAQQKTSPQGTLVVHLNPESFFHGYFRCSSNCVPGGFALHFGRLMKIDLNTVPGYDPDREYGGLLSDFPIKNINQDIIQFMDKLTEEQERQFIDAHISRDVLRLLRIGYNGRYLVYPYLQTDGNYYSGRCIHPDKPTDTFWYGNETFSNQGMRIFNSLDIDHCENGSLIIVEGERNLLILKQFGLPGIAVPTAADLDFIPWERCRYLRTIFLWVDNNKESEAAARSFATKIGFKVRLIQWSTETKKDESLFTLASHCSKEQLQQTLFNSIQKSKAFSPFYSPNREYHHFLTSLTMEQEGGFNKLKSGFPQMDRALGCIRGINIMGGTPKAGKSCFHIQIASQMALNKVPVIYYDFENGRRKIYLRTLSRLSKLSTDIIQSRQRTQEQNQILEQSQQQLQKLLPYLRVVNDRKLTPDLMRRHIDFLRHETNSEFVCVVIDSLHKLPFQDITNMRSGIDGWLRQLEAIRDEYQTSFLVISELARGESGQFDRQPSLGSFKGSGDIAYSADNAMVLLPDWDPFDDADPSTRVNNLWLVASREQSPGKIGSYRLDYPYWGFVEME
ncbi:bifunctional DNA primase/helicase [Desulfogranum japonicum]|uniref:bifunctional DNA primase/helicase n=1 Tax=Desulfogranum japonicum TaxID=231447 RepID=UPI0003F86784|nr:bifunctional DNA primase/helicase [Desulfogranum japonicum]